MPNLSKALRYWKPPFLIATFWHDEEPEAIRVVNSLQSYDIMSDAWRAENPAHWTTANYFSLN
jgi:hypothetical protein